MVSHEHARHRPDPDPQRVATRLGGQWLDGQRVQELDADRPLCPRALDHDRADGDPADRGRVRVHGAALEHGDAAAVGRCGAGRRQPDRRLQGLPAGQGPRAGAPHRAANAAGAGFSPRRRHAAARPETVLLAARPDAVGATRPPDRQAVLDRHRRQFQPGRNPHPARRRRDAHLRPAQFRLCLEFGDLHLLDARHVLDPLDRLGAVPAQPDQADPAAGGRRRKFRQGPRGAELPAPRRAGSPPRGAGIFGNEGAHRALDRAAHRDAGRRQPRSAHHPDPLQARTGR